MNTDLSSLFDTSDWDEDLGLEHMDDKTECEIKLPAKPWHLKTRELKSAKIFADREESASIWLQGKVPAPGHELLCVFTGMWDYWCIPSVILQGCPPGSVKEIYASTWAYNRETLKSFAEHIERHQCKTVFMVTTQHRNRYPEAHYLLLQTIDKYGGTLIQLSQHSKIFLVAQPPNYYCIVGSANMTRNESIEQATISNSKDKFIFYRSFFQHFMPKNERSDYTD